MNLNEFPLWTALVTPMLDDGRVDYSSLEKLVREQESAKNGLLILGSTGEALNLDPDEKKQILEYVIDMKPKSPIMAGVGGINLNATRAWVDYLETLKVDCYLLVTPLYAKPNAKGQEHWFRALLDTASRPCMLYNIPGRTGVAMSHTAIQNLYGHKNFWAIKEASGSVDEFKKYVSEAPDVKVYSGDDILLKDFCAVGAKGLVSVASNVWPSETHQYTIDCLEGTLSDEDDKLWKDASASLFEASNPIPAKRILKELGRISAVTMRAPLLAEDLDSSENLIKWNKSIIEWADKRKG